MALTDHRSALREGLDPDPLPEPDPGERLAAVLALLIDEPEPSLLFTERAAHLSRHPGEVSFPGGLAEPGDDALVATALRETHEEIGLDPALPDVLRARPDLGRKLVRRLACHGSTFSGVGASGKPGAVHSVVLRCLLLVCPPRS